MLIDGGDQFQTPAKSRPLFGDDIKVPQTPLKNDGLSTAAVSECFVADFNIELLIDNQFDNEDADAAGQAKCDKIGNNECYDKFKNVCGQILNDSENQGIFKSSVTGKRYIPCLDQAKGQELICEKQANRIS